MSMNDQKEEGESTNMSSDDEHTPSEELSFQVDENFTEMKQPDLEDKSGDLFHSSNEYEEDDDQDPEQSAEALQIISEINSLTEQNNKLKDLLFHYLEFTQIVINCSNMYNLMESYAYEYEGDDEI